MTSKLHLTKPAQYENSPVWGTGSTGREVLLQALDRGHEVTAIVRHPADLPLAHERLRVVPGDVMQPD